MIFPGYVYYLVPTVWLAQWRAYLGAAGKNVLAVDEPVGFEGFILSLLCEQVIAFPGVSSCNPQKQLCLDFAIYYSGEDHLNVLTHCRLTSTKECYSSLLL